jgi:hypothetical protein
MEFRFDGRVTLIYAALLVSGCDKAADKSASVPQPAPTSTSKSDAAGDNEASVVNSLLVEANNIAARFNKPEGGDADPPLFVSVLNAKDHLSCQHTGDLITPYKGEVQGKAMLTLPGKDFNDGKKRDAIYSIRWPMTYSQGRWSHDRMSVAPEPDVATTDGLSSWVDIVRMRVLSWGQK